MWTLILFAATSMLSDSDSMALTSVPNIPTQQQCIAAGRAADSMFSTTHKSIRYICVQTAR